VTNGETIIVAVECRSRLPRTKHMFNRFDLLIPKEIPDELIVTVPPASTWCAPRLEVTGTECAP
jgi:hypothetical protein